MYLDDYRIIKGNKLLIDYENIIKILLQNKIISNNDLMSKTFIATKLRNKICGFCYKIVDEYDWITEDIQKYCKEHGILYSSLVRLSNEYIYKVILHGNTEEYKKMFEKSVTEKKHMLETIKMKTKETKEKKLKENPPRYFILYDKLLSTNDNDEIVEVIKQYKGNYSIPSLKKFVTRYVSIFHDNSTDIMEQLYQKIDIYSLSISNSKHVPKYVKFFDSVLAASDDYEIFTIITNAYKEIPSFKQLKLNYLLIYHNNSENIEKELDKKFEIYSQYLKDTKASEKKEASELKKQEELDIARQAVSRYIMDKYKNINDFCLTNNITTTTFNQYIEIIKELDTELYNKYNCYINNIHSKNFAILMSKVSNLIQLIKNGIEENGKKREFNIVDYYKYTSLSFDELIRIVNGKINSSDYRILRTFIAKHKNDKKLSPNDIHNLYNQKDMIGIEFDGNGNVIPGTGREITKEEKEKIIKYLKSNNIPITNKTYNIIFKRWLSGELLLQEENKHIK